jgi:hypothetical protein
MAPHEGYHEADGPAVDPATAPKVGGRVRFADLAKYPEQARTVVARLSDAEQSDYNFQQIVKFVDGTNTIFKNIGLKGLTDVQAMAVTQNVSYAATFLEAARRSIRDAVTAQSSGWLSEKNYPFGP